MSCCGSRRQQFRLASQPSLTSDSPPISAGPASAQESARTFVYEGLATFTVLGRVTGKRYHFAGIGARVAVDPRDAPSLRGRAAVRRS